MTDHHETTTQTTPPSNNTNTGNNNDGNSQSIVHSGKTPQQTPETEEQKKYRLTKKFETWCELFLDRSNKDTFGNATQSAIKAYNLDPKKQYSVAGVIGHDNIKKHKSLGSAYLESKGLGFGKLLDVAAAKMYDAKNGGGKQWWDELAIIQGVREPDGAKPDGGTTNTQINVYNLNSPEVDDFNTKFEKFLQSE